MRFSKNYNIIINYVDKRINRDEIFKCEVKAINKGEALSEVYEIQQDKNW